MDILKLSIFGGRGAAWQGGSSISNPLYFGWPEQAQLELLQQEYR